MTDRRRRLHHTMIKPLARELHYLLVHAILHLQQRYGLRLVLHNALHESLAQSSLQSHNAFHGWRQLAMVAGKYHASCLADGYPACSLKCLCCLVNEECGVFLAFEHTVGSSSKRGGDDTCLTEKGRTDAQFQLRSPTLESVHLLMP